MITIEWVNDNKTAFEIKNINTTKIKYDCDLTLCTTKNCPLNNKSLWRKLPYYLLWTPMNFFFQKSNNICVNILFGGGLLTEYEQIKNYILFNKNNISDLTINLIGGNHLNEIMKLNKDNNFLQYDKMDNNKDRAKCFEYIYSRWSIFYKEINNLCEINNIKVKIIICQNILNILDDNFTNMFDSNIIFTFDSNDEIGNSLQSYFGLKKNLELITGQDISSLYICSNYSETFGDDIDIIFSNKFVDIYFSCINLKIKKICTMLIGFGLSMILSK